MEKITTYTMDIGNGPTLHDSTQSVMNELEAAAQEEHTENEHGMFEVTIMVEKRYTRKELDEMPEA